MLKFRNRITKVILRGFVLLSLIFLVFNLVFYMPDGYWQPKLENYALAIHGESSFNPRSSVFQLYSYINHIANDAQGLHQLGTSEGILFHWDDWVDITSSMGGKKKANSLIHQLRTSDPNGSCPPKISEYASFNPYWMESYNTKVSRQIAYTYCLQEIPERVIAMSDDAFIDVPVVTKQRLNIGSKNISKLETIGQMNNAVKNLYQKLPNLIGNQSASKLSYYKTLKVIPKKPLQRSIEIALEDFYFNPTTEIAKLNNKFDQQGFLSAEEQKYLNMIEYANSTVDSADKYFKYPWVISDLIKGQAHHLEATFFKRFISQKERQSVIHHMIRAWFALAEAYGFVSWINYGSLIGWAFNGVNMPWDTDVDIQMPIAELDKLARALNGSLVLENPKLGNSKWYLKVAPHYIRQGNGKNFIDARFIDINSGLYIDISALSKTDYEVPNEVYEGLNDTEKNEAIAVHCKNFNFQLVQELSPIKYTTFEGGGAYIPNKISNLLDRKYGHRSYTSQFHFNHFNYQKDINMWVEDRYCTSPPKGNRYVIDKVTKKIDKSRLSLEGACGHTNLQDDYRINYEQIQRHIKHENRLDEPVVYDYIKAGDLPIFRKDPFEYYEDINNGVVNTTSWYVREE